MQKRLLFLLVYLISFCVRNCQLPLIIQHLLKVGDMPVAVCGIAMEALV